jgi:molybdopterin converting factor small subunit
MRASRKAFSCRRLLWEKRFRRSQAQFAELKKHLYADDGRLRSFVNVYVNDEDIRYLQKDKTSLREGDVISIVPSIAGGVCK